jgi:hypothetical protein
MASFKHKEDDEWVWHNIIAKENRTRRMDYIVLNSRTMKIYKDILIERYEHKAELLFEENLGKMVRWRIQSVIMNYKYKFAKELYEKLDTEIYEFITENKMKIIGWKEM